MMERDRTRDDDTVNRPATSASAPGKRSLVDRLPVQSKAATGAAAPMPAVRRSKTPEAPADDPFALHLLGTSIQARGELDGDDVHAHAARGIAGAATALPHATTIQASFGHHDVSGVQAHVGGPAANAASAIGATAYATGTSVAFASAPDLHLAAHEAAHVVQQRGGVQLKTGVGEAGDRYEQHADAVADAVVRGDSAQALLDQPPGGGSTATAVQRFGGEEHKRMGDDATGGEKLREFTELGIDLSFGDGVMLSGDVLGYLEKEQPKDPQKPRLTSVDYLRDRLRHGGKEGRDEVRWAVWYARSDALRGAEPDVPEAIKAKVRGRYLPLAKENVNHFSHGGTARETYLSMHTQACEKAWRSTMQGQPALFEEAKTDEAFAQHFLSDMFSGGHVRTPRYALDLSERSRDMPSLDNVVMGLSWSIFFELREMGDFGAIAENPIVPHVIVAKIAKMIREKGGADLEQGSYAALVSKAHHDHDGKKLDVVSSRGSEGPTPQQGHRWTAVGDGGVLSGDGSLKEGGAETYRMTVLAMRASRLELDAAARAGASAHDAGFTLESINGGKALDYVPSEVEGANDDLTTGTPEWTSALDATIRDHVLPRIRAFFPVEAVMSEGGMALHVGAALKKVADDIEGNPTEWLQDAMLIQIPNVQGSGPPDVAGVRDEPRDAGVDE